MKETRFYRQINTKDELPNGKTPIELMTDSGWVIYFPVSGNWVYKDHSRAYPDWYLEEFSLEEIMVEFAAWKDRNFRRLDQNKYTPLYSGITPTLKEQMDNARSYEWLVNEYLKTKGYI